jgi:hypothetical protein
MTTLQKYCIGIGIPNAKDIYGLTDNDNALVIGEHFILFSDITDGDGPENNVVLSYAEIFGAFENWNAITVEQRSAAISANDFQDSEKQVEVDGEGQIDFIEVWREKSTNIFSGSEVNAVLLKESFDSYTVQGTTVIGTQDYFFSPIQAILAQGKTYISDRDLYFAIDGGSTVKNTSPEWSPVTVDGLCCGQSEMYPFEKDVLTSAEYRVLMMNGAISASSETVGKSFALTEDGTELIAPGVHKYNIAGVGVIKYNRDNFVLFVNDGVVASSVESFGYEDEYGNGTGINNAYIQSQELFPTKYNFIASPFTTPIDATSYQFVIQYPTTTPASLPPQVADFTVLGTAGWTVSTVTGSGYGPYVITVGGSANSGTVGLFALVEVIGKSGDGFVVGHADIREQSQVTILNKPNEAYAVVITGAVGDGSQIVYSAINDLSAGEVITINRARPLDPADWWCLGSDVVVESSTGSTFIVLSANTGDYSNAFGDPGYVSPPNDGYALVTFSDQRYGPDGPQRYPSVDVYSTEIGSNVFVNNINFKYNISALEVYNYRAALNVFSGGVSTVAGNIIGVPFVIEGQILLSSEVSGDMTVFDASQISGYGGLGNPAGVYGTGVYK